MLPKNKVVLAFRTPFYFRLIQFTNLAWIENKALSGVFQERDKRLIYYFDLMGDNTPNKTNLCLMH